MKPPAPERVANVETYWVHPPPERSPRCAYWVTRIEGGWRPSGRLKSEGYYGSAKYYGVYIWEYINVISPLLDKSRSTPASQEEP